RLLQRALRGVGERERRRRRGLLRNTGGLHHGQQHPPERTAQHAAQVLQGAPKRRMNRRRVFRAHASGYDAAMRVLVVEDDPDMARFITRGLGEQAYAVDAVMTGDAAIERAMTTPYDAIVLDVMIPAPDGLEVCRVLRQHGTDTPILMPSAIASKVSTQGPTTTSSSRLNSRSCWLACARWCGGGAPRTRLASRSRI